MSTRVWKGEVRDTEQALAGFGKVDYADCYLFELPGNLGIQDKAARLDAATLAAFGRMPGFVDALLRLRNALVRPLGLKTDLPWDRIGPDGAEVCIPVLARDDEEIVMGKGDKHLDFRAAVRLEDGGAGREFVAVTTWVHYNNWLGPTYFFFVKPFHRLVVRIVMARAARRLEGS